MRPRRSASTCAALVGETWPERLADGATTGPPNAASSARATGCAGTRTATLSSPASARSATRNPAAFGSTSVSGPGQNAAASRSAVGVETREPPRGGDIGDMRDQRIERAAGPWRRRAAPPPRLGGVGAEPVDGLGRKGDEPAGGKAARRRRNRGSRSACKIRVPGSAVIESRSCLRFEARRGYKTAPQSECSAVW